MKILLLNPKIDAEHKISRGLEEKNIALLFPEDHTEAWQMLQLHGSSIDLAVLHLENLGGENQPTLDLITKIKSDSVHGDLPLILTTDRWTEKQCSEHQAGPIGANAYLRWPFTGEDLYGLIQAILGGEPSEGASPPPPPEVSLQMESPSASEPSSDSAPASLPEPPSEPRFGLLSEPLAERDEGSAEPPEQEVIQEMPYLFSGGPKKPESSVIFAEPVGDAVVPGGAAHSPDLETLKKYLLLREQDVGVLSNQLKAMQEQVAMLENQLKEEKAKNSELTHVANEQKHQLEEFEKEKLIAMEGLQNEINDVRFQVKTKTDKARVLESQVREVTEEMERLKERVRSDIRKIRVREKELENRLEIMKKDSEALIGARENKIIELKRKLDLMEFNMDLLQDQHSKEKEYSARLKERLAKAAQVVRVAGGLLDAGKEGRPDVEITDAPTEGQS